MAFPQVLAHRAAGLVVPAGRWKVEMAKVSDITRMLLTK